jgi:membrane-associated protein
MEQFFTDVWSILVQIVTNFTNPDKWELLKNPAVFWSAFVVVNIIVFTETGLLIGFFLPGDSLLVTLGIVAYGFWEPGNTILLALALCVSAVVGDTVGYWIGKKGGPKLFRKEKSFLFRKDYLLMAQAFYDRHGGKTIILARFVPIIRTFAPVVAGIGNMPYRRFLMFNVVGGISWIISMMAFGYTLHFWSEPLINWVGKQLGYQLNFKVERNVDIIVITVVLISVLPIVWKGSTAWLAKRKANKAAPAAAGPS